MENGHAQHTQPFVIILFLLHPLKNMKSAYGHFHVKILFHFLHYFIIFLQHYLQKIHFFSFQNIVSVLIKIIFIVSVESRLVTSDQSQIYM